MNKPTALQKQLRKNIEVAIDRKYFHQFPDRDHIDGLVIFWFGECQRFWIHPN